ncbi:hypothetical protein KNJ79_05345 [Sphingopyxis indica]|uniref:hypothetical protein n=1 Tax=Sphingopyxis indica TaxID=436663 RepID=UPI0029390A3B|nr:hypothetical protein [Sphingopyxis indica]WOF44358.1 hypothetical protein KNJ79_05345 [Sphingopyxis indica]
MRAGLDFSQLVTFDDGAPDGDISWALYRLDGTEITSGMVTPAANAVSAVILVDGAFNLFAGGNLREMRELTWAYTTGGQTRSGSADYAIEGKVPFPVSPSGVREKLGVTAKELPDEETDLIGAYWELGSISSDTALAAYANLETADAYRIADGIEALAALEVLDTLQVRIAKMESSGTNEFQRGAIDWEMLRGRLGSLVSRATDILEPANAGGATGGSLFVLATISDDFSG